MIVPSIDLMAGRAVQLVGGRERAVARLRRCVEISEEPVAARPLIVEHLE